MAWSTSQLAELAGTTVKAVRHYHKVGLLEEPERRSNGYKQYQVSHLLRLLQISRLAELGVPLAEIASLGRADKDPDEALRVLDAELEATVSRLQRIRGELALILRHRSPAELPAGFGEVADELSEADRSLVMIYARVFDDHAMNELLQAVKNEPRTELDREFEALAPDAERGIRRRLGELLAPSVARQLEQTEWLRDPGSVALRNSAEAGEIMVAAVRDLYNPAQLEVMYRAHLIGTGDVETLTRLEATLDESGSDG
ncbi:MerR family transcriptional regulator [Herbiconiux sp.]|uniref:MerR family transcriptional regulator n=1 Tax=Herbiconiux sp. TaxID=1871186 RepID=UPI0025BA5744|nr:MerR family transcriptional regulator [Herbiconiux sp.]